MNTRLESDMFTFENLIDGLRALQERLTSIKILRSLKDKGTEDPDHLEVIETEDLDALENEIRYIKNVLLVSLAKLIDPKTEIMSERWAEIQDYVKTRNPKNFFHKKNIGTDMMNI